jgi:hypothetical protein
LLVYLAGVLFELKRKVLHCLLQTDNQLLRVSDFTKLFGFHGQSFKQQLLLLRLESQLVETVVVHSLDVFQFPFVLLELQFQLLL